MKDTVVLFKGHPFDPVSPDAVQAYWPPLSLLSLAGPLRDNGFNVIILEHRCTPDENWEKITAVAERVLYVGISALTGFEIHDGLDFCGRVKAQWPEVPVIWGGWHACSLPLQTLADHRVDVVITNIGQQLSVRIAQRLQKGVKYFKDLPFTLSKESINTSPQPTDELPLEPMNLINVALPAYDMLDLEQLRCETINLVRKKMARGLAITGYITYVTSFGCPFHCTYCANHSVFGNKWAGYDIVKIAEQIKWLASKGFNWIEFIDAEFLIRWKRLKELLNAIIEAGIEIRWSSQASVQAILQLEKNGLMPLVIQSGCFSFNIGAESGSEKVLGYIEKRQSATEILETARILRKYGLEGSFNCLIGLPKTENMQDLASTFRLAYQLKQINPDFTFPISFYTPLPGSKMFIDSEEVGFISPKNLEEWGRYQTSYRVQAEALPWRNSSFERLVYLVVTFYLPMAVPGNIRRGTIRNLKQHLQRHPLRQIIKLGHNLARLRMEYQFFRLPVEYYLFKFWQRMTRRPEYSPGAVVDAD